MKLLATHKAEQNQAGIDPWTAVHLSAGLALGLMDAPLRRALPAALAYEAIEQIFERQEAGRSLFKTAGPEAGLNVVVDIAVFVAGHALGRWWNQTAAP